MNLLNFDNQLGEKGGHIIYVYGIGPHASESDLYTLFQNVGPILRVNVIKNQKTGLGKGYGFVVFEHYEEACFAVQQMNGFIFNNRPLQVAFKAFNKNQ
jgi:RNA recognition motif-containing protein